MTPAADPFDRAPPELARRLRAHDEGLRRELRRLGIGLVVSGLGLGGLAVVRLGALVPLAVGLGVSGLGGWLWWRARRLGGLRHLVAHRLHEVTSVALVRRRARYSTLWYAEFTLRDGGREDLELGPGEGMSEAEASALVDQARHLCGLAQR